MSSRVAPERATHGQVDGRRLGGVQAGHRLDGILDASRARFASACRVASRARRCCVADLPHDAILAARADTPTPAGGRGCMRHDAGVTSGTSSRLQRGLVVLGIVVLAFNLRPAAVSIGPVLGEVSDGLGMTTTETGRAHLLAGARLRPLRRPRAAPGARRRAAPAHPRGAALPRRRARGPRGRVVGAGVPRALAARPRRDGVGQRAAAVTGQAALPGPDRAAHLALLDRARGRPDLRVGAHRPGRRGVRRMAVRPAGVGPHRRHRGHPLARPDRPRPPAREGRGARSASSMSPGPGSAG